MLDEARCRRILNESFPELKMRSIRYFAEGWDYEMWEVNDDLLFRFPRRAECAEPLRTEARLLVTLADALSLPVPRPEYLSDGCAAHPMPFLGYRRLIGRPLDEATLDERDRLTVARQLGRFLSELHGFPSERAAELGVPCYSTQSWRESFRDLRAQVRSRVLPLLSPDERACVETFWHDFLDDDRHFRFEPVLIHADLGLEHVLVDDERTAITGVIDFGDARRLLKKSSP